MSELGQHLKEVREQKEITLDDLQRTTKIQKRYLVAIEEGRFDTLPGLFYARAFVKTYAEAIGLDPEPLFDQYKDDLPSPEREAITLPSRTDRTKVLGSQKHRPNRKSVLPAILAIVIIAVIIYSVWVLAQEKGSGESSNKPVSPNESENLEADFSGEVGKSPDDLSEGLEEEEEQEEVPAVEPEDVMTTTFTQSEGKVSYFNLENGQLNDVRIELLGTSHVDVKNAEGHTFYTGMPVAGEELTFDELVNEKQVTFNFGASQNAKLFIGDELVEFPLDIIHQKITINVIE